MLLYQSWTRSSSNTRLRCVHARVFPVNTVLPRYRDRSSSANTILVCTLPRSCVRPHVIRVLRYPRCANCTYGVYLVLSYTITIHSYLNLPLHSSNCLNKRTYICHSLTSTWLQEPASRSATLRGCFLRGSIFELQILTRSHFQMWTWQIETVFKMRKKSDFLCV